MSLFIAGVFITLVIVAVVIAIIAITKKNTSQLKSETDILSIVRIRYANGEIQKEEYDQLIADLTLEPKAKQ